MTTLPASPPPHSPSLTHHPTVASDSANWAIDLHDVAKTFKGKKGPIHALNGIDMRVPAGSIFGLLGPNGAGKSTLVKILMTVIRPTRCRGTMLGKPVGHKPTLARIGYLPEHHRFPDYLTAEQILDHFGAMSLVPRRDRKKRIPELLELVGISSWSKTKVRGFSKGMRQRLGIANALVNDPDLVLLDEPTDGVDPVGRRDIRNILFELKRRGKTVFLNSHLLSELEMVCDTAAILVQGGVYSYGTIQDLTRDGSGYEIEITDRDFASPAQTNGVDTSARIASLLGPQIVHAEHAPSVQADRTAPTSPPQTYRLVSVGATSSTLAAPAVHIKGHTIVIDTLDAANIQPLIDTLRARNVEIRSVRPVRPTLEDLFMKAVVDPQTGKVLKPGAKLEAQP